jgi:glutamate-1-semialdehyde aminotransferase
MAATTAHAEGWMGWSQGDWRVPTNTPPFCVYFMDHCLKDWHDLAACHDFGRDQQLRVALIGRGVYLFPTATKQCSISFTHTEDDIDFTLEQINNQLKEMVE